MYELHIEIEGLPPIISNGSHGHWATKYKIKKTWSDLALLKIGSNIPGSPLKKAIGIFTRFSTTEPDSDNLAISFKSIRDALVKSGVILDDKSSILKAEYRWEKAKQKQGKITVSVLEVKIGNNE